MLTRNVEQQRDGDMNKEMSQSLIHSLTAPNNWGQCLELNPDLPNGWQGTKFFNHHQLPPRHRD